MMYIHSWSLQMIKAKEFYVGNIVFSLHIRANGSKLDLVSLNFVYFVSQYQYSQFYRENASEVFRLASQLETNKDQLDALKRHSVQFWKLFLQFVRVSLNWLSETIILKSEYRLFVQADPLLEMWSRLIKELLILLLEIVWINRLQKDWNHSFFKKFTVKS